MNKTLLAKVKDLCKDTGLSEKYLTTITEKMGGSIEDDSTDEKAIGDMANQIAEIAQETQGEATRWASKKILRMMILKRMMIRKRRRILRMIRVQRKLRIWKRSWKP